VAESPAPGSALLARPGDFAADGTASAALPDGGRVLLVHDGDHVRAYRDHCPHRAGSLGDAAGRFLDAGSALLRCDRHGALFLPASGECLAGPCQGKRLTPVPVSVDDAGVVHLAMQ